MKKLFLLDAFALIYRSYYAFIKNPRYNSKGLNTSAILGFTNTLLEVLEKQKPSHIAVVFDPKGKTFRHEEYSEYKAQRPPMPEEIRSSIPYIEDILKGFNIPALSVEGYEADDVIGTLAHKADSKLFEVFMMTPDKDYAQLVREHIFMFKPKRSGKEEEVWGVAEVKENFGIENPIQVIDTLGLMGDSSDNIPGCPGIGPKTAQKIIAKYGTIEDMYNHLDDFRGKQKENLTNFKEQVLLSKHLATIKLDVPISLDTKSLELKSPNKERLQELFSELEFATLSRRLFNTETPTEKTKKNQPKQEYLQGSLFDDGNFGFTEEKRTSRQTISTQNFLMNTKELRQDLKAEICLKKEYSISFAFTSSTVSTSRILGFSIAFSKDESFFVPTPNRDIFHEFKHIFADKNITMIAHDVKEVLVALYRQGLIVKNKIWDTLLAHYVLQPELKHDLSYISQQMLDIAPSDIEESLGKGRKKINIEQLPLATIQNYICEKSIITLLLKDALLPMLQKRDVLDLFERIEIPLVWVLAKMEYNGASIDTEMLADYQKELTKELNAIENEIKTMANEPELNVSSPKQLGEVLFDKMKLNNKAKKTASGQYSTSESVLVKLKGKHPIIEKILSYRSLSKLISTYVEALPSYLSPLSKRIHSNFNQAETATGRLSSTNPNLQNIPIRTPKGRYIRRAFVASDQNHVFISADYSQVELRIMAHLSGDKHMQAAFQNNMDIHAATAAKIFKVELNEVTPEMRRQAKTANFGIIYGISAWGLAERLGISRSEGKQLIDGYFESYPRIKAFMDEAIKNAREKGFVETIMKRKRYLKDINSNNAIVRGVAERNAINAPIQGSAADIIKLAMIRIYKAMQGADMKSEMILQVHDELNFNCMQSEQEQLKRIIKEGMEQAVNLSVPLTAEIGVGANWLEAH